MNVECKSHLSDRGFFATLANSWRTWRLKAFPFPHALIIETQENCHRIGLRFPDTEPSGFAAKVFACYHFLFPGNLLFILSSSSLAEAKWRLK